MPEEFRHAGSEEETEAIPPLATGRNLIVTIGIDDYTGWRKLHNAVADARGVRDLFVDRLSYTEPIKPLINADATQDNIAALIQDTLPAVLKDDDSLVIFFAGHGHTEKRTAAGRTINTGYLIPVDAKAPVDGKFSSYIKLGAFLDDVSKLPARHVLLILDACYSGFALDENIEILRDGTPRYTEDLSRRVSRRIMTSAMADQPAQDNGPVPNHSLFTGTLIEALDPGRADEQVKGFVTSSELALYVQLTVGSWSGSKQTPDFGAFSALDERGELVISLRGETYNRAKARECLAAGDALFAVGEHTAQRGRFEGAAREYRAAIRFANLGKQSLPQAEAGLNKALALLAGKLAPQAADLKACIATLERIAKAREASNDYWPVGRLAIGIAYAELRDMKAAMKWLQEADDVLSGRDVARGAEAQMAA